MQMEGYVLASFQAASAAILNIERDTLGSKSLSLTTNSDQTDKNCPRKQAALPEAVEPPATDRGSGPQAAEDRALDETRSTTQVAASPQQSALRNGLMMAGKRSPRCCRSPPPFVETQSVVDEHPVGIVKEQTDNNNHDEDDEDEDEADWMFVSAPVAPASNGTTSIGSNNRLKSTKLLIDFSSDDEDEDNNNNTTEPQDEIMASPTAPDQHEDCDDGDDDLEKSSHHHHHLQQAEEEKEEEEDESST